MSVNKDGIFSIIIPVYNAEITIERCLASLISNAKWIREVIIVNDRCTDSTINKVRKFKRFLPIRILKNAGDKGPGPARQTGLIAATGEWITFVDADDSLLPTCLFYVEKKINECESDEENVVVIRTPMIDLNTGEYESEFKFIPNQCCGHFYKKSYLSDNRIYFHPKLYMVEDEYFTNKLDKYLEHLNFNDAAVVVLDYPVYIEQHDDDLYGSFTNNKWPEYLITNRLLYRRLIVEEFWAYINLQETLTEEYFGAIIFAYYMLCALRDDDTVDFVVDDQVLQIYKDALQFLREYMHVTEYELLIYYDKNPEIVQALIDAVGLSSGMTEFTLYNEGFERFILSIS